MIDAAAEVAGRRTVTDTDQETHECRDDANHERDPPAEQCAHEQIPAERIGAEDMAGLEVRPDGQVAPVGKVVGV